MKGNFITASTKMTLFCLPLELQNKTRVSRISHAYERLSAQRYHILECGAFMTALTYRAWQNK